MALATLCEDCLNFIDWLSSSPKWRMNLYKYPKDGHGVLKSSRDCKLCAMIVWAEPDRIEKVRKIDMRFKEDWNGHIAAVEIWYIIERVPPSLMLRELFLWTDKDSAAASEGRISTLPVFHKDGGPNTIDLIQSWIDRCSSKHKTCQVTLAKEMLDGEDLALPCDRILDLGNGSDDMIYLIKANGITGRYCTLSHCWGSANERPTCVTSENESRFFAGFSMADLPKTFRHAVHITRALHIRYLWIDSLCILQDNKNHWRKQSAIMGAIYEHAFLRLAACSAHNCTEGMYSEDVGSRPPPIVIPFRPSDQIGQMYFSPGRCSLMQSSSISNIPLSFRGWAFQESKLARRTVLFTHGYINWECREMELDERNRIIYSSHPQHECFIWELLISQYSRCNLTYESDRFIALQGLANEFARTCPDRYHLGIWLAEVPRQLLWRICSEYNGMRGNLDLPTWTWARLPGSKSYILPYWSEVAQDVIGHTTFLSWNARDQSLFLQGSILKCKATDPAVNSSGYDGMCSEEPEAYLWSDSSHDGQVLRYLWSLSTPKEELIGLIELDDNKRYDELYLCIILACNRRKYDYFRTHLPDEPEEMKDEEGWLTHGLDLETKPRERYLHETNAWVCLNINLQMANLELIPRP